MVCLIDNDINERKREKKDVEDIAQKQKKENIEIGIQHDFIIHGRSKKYSSFCTKHWEVELIMFDGTNDIYFITKELCTKIMCKQIFGMRCV